MFIIEHKMTTLKKLPSFTVLEGKVHVFMREGSPFWWVGFHYKGRYLRKTTKQTDEGAAKAFAHDWYFKKQTEIASGEVASPKLQGGFKFQVQHWVYLDEV